MRLKKVERCFVWTLIVSGSLLFTYKYTNRHSVNDFNKRPFKLWSSVQTTLADSVRGIDRLDSNIDTVPVRSIDRLDSNIDTVPVRSIDRLDSNIDTVPVRSIDRLDSNIDTVPVRSIDRLDSNIDTVPVRSIDRLDSNIDTVPVRSIDRLDSNIDTVPVRSIDRLDSNIDTVPVRSIDRLDSNIDTVPVRSIDRLDSNIDTVPVRSIDRLDSNIDTVPVRSIDRLHSNIDTVPVRSIDRLDSNIDTVPVRSIDRLDSNVDTVPVRSIDRLDSNIDTVPVRSIDRLDSNVDTVPVRSVDRLDSNIDTVPVRSIDRLDSNVDTVPVRSIDRLDSNVDTVPVRSIDRLDSNVDTVPVRSIDRLDSNVDTVPVRSIDRLDSNVDTVPVRSIGILDSYVDSVSQSQSDFHAGIHYCNSPLKPVTGSEGETHEGFKLKMVHVLFRHGDRVHDGETLKPESCFINTSLFENDDILERFVKTMTEFTCRESTGSYFNGWLHFPNYANCLPGGLTGIGAAQLIRLGQYFRNKYLTPSGMFSNDIPLTSQIYTGSSLFRRTYQSAIAFLFGFLQQTEFNLTKLHIDLTDMFLCLKEGIYKKKCNASPAVYLDQQLSKIRQGYLNSANTSFVTREISTVLEFMYLIILTYCRNRPQLCLPNNSTICFTSNDFNMVWEKFDKENRYVQEHSPDIKYFYVSYFTVMTQIIDQMYNRINNANQTKLVVYSNHDRILISFLKVFGVDGNWIRYAGRIVLELYESNMDINTPGETNDIQEEQNNNFNHVNDTKSHYSDTFSQNNETQRQYYNARHKHYIKFFYDGKDLTESVTFCKGKTFKGLCEFSLFYDFVYTEMQQEIATIVK